MLTNFITYRSGYKYQLEDPYSLQTNIKPAKDVNRTFVQLTKDGLLTVSAGYAWDGPSGPLIDTAYNMRASLIHDALYQLIRLGELSANSKKDADLLFRDICIQDGVAETFAGFYYLGLQVGGDPYIDPKNERKIHRAP